MNDAAIEAVRAAVNADPNNHELRLALADLLNAAGRKAEAITEAATVLASRPGDARALALVTGAVAAPVVEASAADLQATVTSDPEAPDVATVAPEGDGTQLGSDAAGFDWHAAEQAMGSELPPPFRERDVERQLVGEGGEDNGSAPTEPALPRISFADVGGLDNVKARLNESFIQPMRHAEIAKAFKKSLRGGLLLYGPPGCGKTFMARAVAGELEADFVSVVLTDVVDGVRGQTEKNLHAVFQEARSNPNPTVLFLDEIDALALKRSGLTNNSSWLRSTVNQLLLEMDSMAGNNDGLFVLAATNHPWDLDEAVLRPGRLDRAVLVSPPDATARGAILRTKLSARPVAGVDLDALVSGTDGFSGADLDHLVTTAAEKAMMASIAAGQVLPIGMPQLAEAMREVRPSTAEWLQSARNVVRFAADGGRYDDLRDYLEANQPEQNKGRRKGWWS